VQLHERDPVVEPFGLEQVDKGGEGVGERVGPVGRRDRGDRPVPGVVGEERRALLVLPAGDDHCEVVAGGGPEELEQLRPAVHRGGVPHVVPPGALAVVTAQPAQPQRARVQAGAEEQQRHRADPDRVVAALGRLPERRVEVLERLARPGTGVPGEVPECDRESIRSHLVQLLIW
jgi:hypothetical protein